MSESNGNLGKYGTIGGTVVAVILAGATWLGTQGEDTNQNSDGRGLSQSGKTCAYDSLPSEAKTQIEEILEGTPSDDGPHDGKHFGNYEGRLPKQSSNYYREYTVKTPGLNHRGERRIVVGGGSKTDPDVWFYSSDHYETFCTIPDAEE